MADADVLLLTNAVFWPSLIETTRSGSAEPRWIEIRDGRIVRIGQSGEPEPEVERRIDLDSHVVLPGFVDTHVHLGWHAEDRWTVNWSAVADRSAALHHLRTVASRVAADHWITGGDWLAGQLPDSELPTLAELDEASARRPIFLRSHDYRIAVLNTRALTMAGISADTPDPPGGLIERDSSGRATGVLRDEAVWSRLAAGVVAPRNRFRQLAELRDLLTDLAERGITEVHDIGTYPRQDTLAPFHEERSFTDAGLIDELDRRAELSLRYSYRPSLLRVSEYDDLVAPRPDGSALMQFGGFKMSLDNGWYSQPAGPRVDSFRYPGSSEASKLIDQADRVDAAVSIHAIGDLGVAEALDLLATVGSRRGTDRLPHRVIHARRISPGDITRCAELGVALEMQPWEIVAQGQRMAARGNADFASGISAFASMIEAGCLLIFGSDRRLGLRLDQRDTDPMLAVQLAVTRQHPDRPDDPVWQPGQRITLDQALRSATQAGAVAAGAEALRGLIGTGRQADLVVLDADPRQVPTNQIEKVRPLLTVSAGRPVFDRISGREFR